MTPKVLVACEESQAVTIEMRKLGIEAYSCDIIECSGGHPEWHIMGDALKLLTPDCKSFTTMDGTAHTHTNWDMLIAHPPCTYLSNASTRSFSLRVTPAENVVSRWEERAKAAVFFMHFYLANVPRVAVENPVGFMNNALGKASQIIDPYMFAASVDDKENYVTKRTCLWLRGLPKLEINSLPKPNNAELYGRYSTGKAKCWEEMQSSSPGNSRGRNRSKTFPGVARAMAEQWGGLLLKEAEA